MLLYFLYTIDRQKVDFAIVLNRIKSRKLVEVDFDKKISFVRNWAYKLAL